MSTYRGSEYLILATIMQSQSACEHIGLDKLGYGLELYQISSQNPVLRFFDPVQHEGEHELGHPLGVLPNEAPDLICPWGAASARIFLTYRHRSWPFILAEVVPHNESLPRQHFLVWGVRSMLSWEDVYNLLVNL